MARILAIDYGKKRTGIAVSDPSRIIATGLETLSTPDVMDFLRTYISKEQVDIIVIGEAKQMNNSESESMVLIRPFYEQLVLAFPGCKVHMYDERFTSKMAFRAMIDGGLKKKDRQNKATVDKVSAVLLLQSFMEFQQNQPS
jgi:putative Holliday junction resolvase